MLRHSEFVPTKHCILGHAVAHTEFENVENFPRHHFITCTTSVLMILYTELLPRLCEQTPLPNMNKPPLRHQINSLGGILLLKVNPGMPYREEYCSDPELACCQWFGLMSA